MKKGSGFPSMVCGVAMNQHQMNKMKSAKSIMSGAMATKKI
jgi:hypothetical protein